MYNYLSLSTYLNELYSVTLNVLYFKVVTLMGAASKEAIMVKIMAPTMGVVVVIMTKIMTTTTM